MQITTFIVANLPYLHLFLFGNNNLVDLAFVYRSGIAHFRDFALPQPCVSIAMFLTHSCCSPYKGFWNLQTKNQQKTIPRFFYISLSTEEGLKKIKRFKYCNLFHISNQIKQEQNKITLIMKSIIEIARFQWVVCFRFSSFSFVSVTITCKSSLIRKRNFL